MAATKGSPRLVLLVGGLALGVLLLFLQAIAALPGLHHVPPPRVGHYQTEARQWQAQQGRAIMANPNSPCSFYDCTGSDSLLRVCVGQTDAGDVVHALQWLFFDGGAWNEGTIFLQRKPGKVERYLRNYGCREMVQ